MPSAHFYPPRQSASTKKIKYQIWWAWNQNLIYKKGNYCLWSWIQMKTVIKVPNYGLYAQGQRAKMALMHYGSNKLQKRIVSKWPSRWFQLTKDGKILCRILGLHAQMGRLFLQLKEASDMIYAFCKAYLHVEIQFLAYKIWFCFQPKRRVISLGSKQTINISN